MTITEADLEALRYAKGLLESPGLASKVINVIGVPIEKGFELLPDKWSSVVNGATRKALDAALQFALVTLDDRPRFRSYEMVHKLMVTATGAGGGAFGLPALALELPVSTTIILRSIADIARREGEALRSIDTKLACLEVFALGGRSTNDDGVESAYFAVRGLRELSQRRLNTSPRRGSARRGHPPS